MKYFRKRNLETIPNRKGIIPNNLANSVTKIFSIGNDYVPGKDQISPWDHR